MTVWPPSSRLWFVSLVTAAVAMLTLAFIHLPSPPNIQSSISIARADDEVQEQQPLAVLPARLPVVDVVYAVLKQPGSRAFPTDTYTHMQSLFAITTAQLSKHQVRFHVLTNDDQVAPRMRAVNPSVRIHDLRSSPMSERSRAFLEQYAHQSSNPINYERLCMWRWLVIADYFAAAALDIDVQYIMAIDTDVALLEHPIRLLDEAVLQRIATGTFECNVFVVGAALLLTPTGLENYAQFFSRLYTDRDRAIAFVRRWGEVVPRCAPHMQRRGTLIPCDGKNMYHLSDMHVLIGWLREKRETRSKTQRQDCLVVAQVGEARGLEATRSRESLTSFMATMPGAYNETTTLCLMHFQGNSKRFILPFKKFVESGDRTLTFSIPMIDEVNDDEMPTTNVKAQVNAIPPLDAYPEWARNLFNGTNYKLHSQVFNSPMVVGREYFVEVVSVDGAWHDANAGAISFANEEHAFGATIIVKPSSGSILRFVFTPPQAGTFEMAIDLMAPQGMMPLRDKRCQRVHVVGDDVDVSAVLPHCTDLTDEGYWVRSKPDGFRWPFTFQSSSCVYENWSTKQLQRFAATAEQKQWLVFAGSSKLRGVFLSAVDHLLGAKPGDFAHIDKCWGRIDVEVGNVKLTYQDYRAMAIVEWPLRASTERPSFTCHDNGLAILDSMEYFYNATSLIKNMFSDAAHQPTAFITEFFPNRAPELFHELIIKHLPTEWPGKFIVMLIRARGSKDLATPPRLTDEQRAEWAERIRWPSAQVVDVYDLQSPWFHTAEFGTTGASQHWHYCTQPHETIVSFAIKGILTDMLAQMVFNVVFGEKPTISLAHTLANPLRVNVCADCPATLLPFLIKPVTNLNDCQRSLPWEGREQSFGAQPECPAWCLRQPIAHSFETQTNTVNVRNCQM